MNYIIEKDFISHLYRYTGFLDIGNHNEKLISEWIFSDEMPDVKLYETVYERLWGGVIEKASIAIPYVLEDDQLWINKDDISFWLNDFVRMTNDYDDVENELIKEYGIRRDNKYDIYNI